MFFFMGRYMHGHIHHFKSIDGEVVISCSAANKAEEAKCMKSTLLVDCFILKPVAFEMNCANDDKTNVLTWQIGCRVVTKNCYD